MFLFRVERSLSVLSQQCTDAASVLNTLHTLLEKYEQDASFPSEMVAIDGEAWNVVSSLSEDEMRIAKSEVGKLLRVLGMTEKDLESCLAFIRKSNLKSVGQDEVSETEMIKPSDYTGRKLAALLSENSALSSHIEALESEASQKLSQNSALNTHIEALETEVSCLRQKVIQNDDEKAANEYQTEELIRLKMEMASVQEDNLKLRHELQVVIATLSEPVQIPAHAHAHTHAHAHAQKHSVSLIRTWFRGPKKEESVAGAGAVGVSVLSEEQQTHLINRLSMSLHDATDSSEAIKDLEGQLIAAKIHVADAEFDKLVMITEMKTLAKKLAKLQMEYGELCVSLKVSPGATPTPPLPLLERRHSIAFSPMLSGHSESDEILSQDDIHQILAYLPARYQYSDWQLLFSTTKDGYNLNTLFRRVADMGPTIIVARDERGDTLGGYASDTWRLSDEEYHPKTRSANNYFGNGETFVFSTHAPGGPPATPDAEKFLAVYPWTKANDFFLCARGDLLAFGGGSNFAFCVDGDLARGGSGDCETFGSPQLSANASFNCLNLQVWGLEAFIANVKRHGGRDFRKPATRHIFRDAVD